MTAGRISFLALTVAAALLGGAVDATAAETLSDSATWGETPQVPRAKFALGDRLPLHMEPGEPKRPAPALPDTDSSLPASPLETMYSARVVDSLEQFGYDLFAASRPHNERDTFSVPAGAAQDDFVLNIGDELSITLRGQKQLHSSVRIDSEGMLIVDTFAPIPAAGRTLAQVREQLAQEAAQTYNTQAFLSLSKVNQVNILVAGHVKNPGRKTLTGFDTVLDALIEAGGIEKTGTLRQIRLIRDGRTTVIDLYGLLIYGSEAADMGLRNGDKIMVRPVGPTVAISGGVKRPGIYEILPALQGNWNSAGKSQLLAMNDLLDMAGGVLSSAQNRFLRLGINQQGEEAVQEISDSMQRVFSDGDILSVERGQERRAGTVEMVGHANTLGLHALSETKSLVDLLAEEGSLKRDTYPLIGVIERWNRKDMTRSLIAFPPLLAISRDYDRTLEDGDIIHLFSTAQIKALQNPQPEIIPVAMGSVEDADENTLDPLIAEFLKERCVFLRGAVRQPGAYPVSAGATLETLLKIAGGTSIEANTRNIEISRAVPSDKSAPSLPPEARRLAVNLLNTDAGTIALGAGDTVRINQKYKRVEDTHALIVGEVANPGTYDIMPGDTLGSLLARAGGINDIGYPEGAIFSRVSERKREESRFKAQARDLELRLAAMLEEKDEDKRPSEREVAAARDLITQLRDAEALGRITIQANAATLDSHPEQDILLEGGDRIFIPKRPMTVRVAGEVLSPVALQYQARQSSADYVAKAGGYTYNADKGRTFVVFPDGSARPLGSWGSGSGNIPPGSTIVVPRDPKPFDFMDTAKDLTQILANLATTVVFTNALNYSDD